MIKYICDICGQDIIFNKQIERSEDYQYVNTDGTGGHACKKCKEEEENIRTEEFSKAQENTERRMKEFVKDKLKQKGKAK